MARLCALVLVLICAEARAADEPYKVHNREGVKRAKAGQYEQAIVEFKKAEALFKRYEHHCNIGRAYSELKRWPQAFLFLESCRLRWGPQVDPWVQQFSEAAQKALRAGDYAAIELVTAGAVTVRVKAFGADEEWSIDDRRHFWLPYGEHVLQVTPAHGEPWEQALQVATRDARTVTLARPVAATVAVVEPVAVVEAPAPKPVETPVAVVVPAPPPPEPRAVVAPWVVVGLGAVATGIGVAGWFTAKGISDRIDGKVSGAAFDGPFGDFQVWRGVAYGGLIAGPVLIAGGLLWRMLSPSSTSVPVVSIGRDGFAVGWTTAF